MLVRLAGPSNSMLADKETRRGSYAICLYRRDTHIAHTGRYYKSGSMGDGADLVSHRYFLYGRFDCAILHFDKIRGGKDSDMDAADAGH